MRRCKVKSPSAGFGNRRRHVMTNKSDFTNEEWELVREGPPTAGMVAATAASGGSFRESWALAKAFAEARQHHGESEFLDALVAEKPHVKRYGSPTELEQQGLQQLREAVTVLEQKGTSEELDAYRRFTLDVAERVAAAHKEGGTDVSTDEQAALERIEAALRSGNPS
jgi:hypothetical protein